MTASVWEPGDDIPLLNAQNTLVPQNFTVSAFPTTLFNLTNFTYVPGTGSLNIYINGVKQRIGIDFVETSSSSFTLLESPYVNDSVTAEGFVGISVDIPDAEYLRLQLAASTGATMVGTSGYGILSLSTVEQNLQEIVNALGTVLQLQAVQIQTGVAFSTAGSSTAYTVDMTGQTVNADTVNTKLQLTFDETNTTTTPTLQPTGWTARSIKVFDSDGNKINPAVGSLVAGAIFNAVFDGTNWLILNPLPVSVSTSSLPSTNDMLNWIYQSKLMVSIRVGLNLFADGYKASDGINAGASSNYTLDTANGRVGPVVTPSSPTLIAYNIAGATIVGNMSGGGGLAAAFDNVTSQTAAASARLATAGVIQWVGKDFGLGNSHRIGRFTVYGPNNSTIGGSAGARFVRLYGSNVATGPTTPQDGTLISTGTNADTVAEVYNVVVDSLIAYRWVWVTISTTANAAPADAIAAEIRFYDYVAPTVSNMTVTEVVETASVSSTKASGTFEFVAIDTVVLNTDLTVEFTCNGGTNWQTAVLTDAGIGQAGYKILTTNEVTCIAGTSYATRIKNLNNKNLLVYGSSTTVGA